jgi:hypothetical protein
MAGCNGPANVCAQAGCRGNELLVARLSGATPVLETNMEVTSSFEGQTGDTALHDVTAYYGR